MAIKRKAIKGGLKGAKGAPAKGKLLKVSRKFGKRKAIRTPAGTAVLYGKALIGNQQARNDLREALASARNAYNRSSDRRGRPDIGALFEDRKARRDAGNAVVSLQEALRIAGRKRDKPKSAKAPTIAVIAVAGTGTALVLNKNLRAKVLAPLSGTDSGSNDGGPTVGAEDTPAAQAH